MLNDRLKCNKICGIFEEMMMTMNPTLMNSPCSCLSVYQPCRGPQTDVSGPEPCTFRVGTSSTVGHSISGPGPNQCDPMPTRRRQTVDKQSGPHSSQLRSTSPTSAGLSWVLSFDSMIMMVFLFKVLISIIRNFQQLWSPFTLLGKPFWKFLIQCFLNCLCILS